MHEKLKFVTVTGIEHPVDSREDSSMNRFLGATDSELVGKDHEAATTVPSRTIICQQGIACQSAFCDVLQYIVDAATPVPSYDAPAWVFDEVLRWCFGIHPDLDRARVVLALRVLVVSPMT